jgi:hypothetical protein
VRAETRVGSGDVAGQGQKEREGMLGGADGVAGGGVHHHDALPGGGVLVDVVGTDPGPDDRLESLIARERIGGDLHAAAANRPVVTG